MAKTRITVRCSNIPWMEVQKNLWNYSTIMSPDEFPEGIWICQKSFRAYTGSDNAYRHIYSVPACSFRIPGRQNLHIRILARAVLPFRFGWSRTRPVQVLRKPRPYASGPNLLIK